VNRRAFLGLLLLLAFMPAEGIAPTIDPFVLFLFFHKLEQVTGLEPAFPEGLGVRSARGVHLPTRPQNLVILVGFEPTLIRVRSAGDYPVADRTNLKSGGLEGFHVVPAVAVYPLPLERFGVWLAGFEPASPRNEVLCQLSYSRPLRSKLGAHGRIRTCDPRFRRPMLCSAELHVQKF